MISIDTNILVYAHRADMPDHQAAFAAVSSALRGVEQVGLSWPVLHEFLAVVTNQRIFTLPTPPDLAVEQIENWLSSPAVTLLREGSDHTGTIRQLITLGNVQGPAIHDARIAAICLDSGVRELWTSDRDFSRFPSLRTRNPLLN